MKAIVIIRAIVDNPNVCYAKSLIKDILENGLGPEDKVDIAGVEVEELEDE